MIILLTFEFNIAHAQPIFLHFSIFEIFYDQANHVLVLLFHRFCQ